MFVIRFIFLAFINLSVSRAHICIIIPVLKKKTDVWSMIRFTEMSTMKTCVLIILIIQMYKNLHALHLRHCFYNFLKYTNSLFFDYFKSHEQ